MGTLPWSWVMYSGMCEAYQLKIGSAFGIPVCMLDDICDSSRFGLNLRLDERRFWEGSVNATYFRRKWTACKDVADSKLVADAFHLVLHTRARKVSLRFNSSNEAYSRREFRTQRLATKHRLSLVEEILRDLLLKKSFYDTFHPNSQSSAVFFWAARFIRALYPFFPLISGKSSTGLQMRTPETWQKLEHSLHSEYDLPMDLVMPSESCSLLSALHHLLKADNLRIKAGSDWSGASGMEIQKSFDSAQQQLACTLGQSGKLLQHFRFPKAFVFFDLLDRLDCRAVAAIKPEMLPEEFRLRSLNQTFWMHLMPTVHVESDLIRGKGFFHCGGDRLLHREVAKSREDGGEFRFVEVGASLGGCSWTVLTSHPRSKALAIEAYKPAADAMRRTALENGLADRLMVFESFVSSSSTCHKMAHLNREHVQDALVDDADCKTATLAGILQSWSNATVDLLRIHVNGFEMDVLRSLEKSWPKIQTISLALWASRHFPRDYDPAAISQLLRDFGCTIELNFRKAPLGGGFLEKGELRDEAAVQALQKSEILSPETMTLLAFCGEKSAAFRVVWVGFALYFIHIHLYPIIMYHYAISWSESAMFFRYAWNILKCLQPLLQVGEERVAWNGGKWF